MASETDTIVCDTPESIAFFRLCARKASLSIEIKTGMRRSSRGRTAYSICKEVYGLRGTRQRVLAQVQQLVDDALRARGQEVQAQRERASLGSV